MFQSYSEGVPTYIKASGAILNPWYELPGEPQIDKLVEYGEITKPCRVEFREHNFQLLFKDDAVIFTFSTNSIQPRYLIQPIQYFLIFHTFINYNLVGPALGKIDENKFDEVEVIKFKVTRVNQVAVERRIGEEVFKGFDQVSHEEFIEIKTESISNFIRILNPTLYYALAYYLIGCDNPRYFLIEFYKAVEVIKNKFGAKQKLLRSLAKYGVFEKEFSDFTKTCNDMRLAPVDIGRHAPMPGAKLFSVDLRNLLIEPRSYQVFELSSSFCRKVINAYIEFLIDQAP
jgi:hypothetical protein